MSETPETPETMSIPNDKEINPTNDIILPDSESDSYSSPSPVPFSFSSSLRLFISPEDIEGDAGGITMDFIANEEDKDSIAMLSPSPSTSMALPQLSPSPSSLPGNRPSRRPARFSRRNLSIDFGDDSNNLNSQGENDFSLSEKGSFRVTDDGTFTSEMFSISHSGFTNNNNGNDNVPPSSAQLKSLERRRRASLMGDFNSSTLLELGTLGRGAGGRVVKCLHVPSTTIVAMKCIDVNDKGKRGQLIKELKELDTEKSLHIVDFFSAFYEGGNVKLCLEFMNRGSLQSLVDKKYQLSELVISSVAKQALMGLKHLHLNKKLHRDVKPGNILLNWRGVVKLSDFGIIAELAGKAEKCDTFVGTVIYMSPERLSSLNYSYPSDIWALGMSLITLANGVFPMSVTSGYWGLLTELNKNPPPTMPKERFSPACCDFIDKMLQKDPNDRWSATALLTHPFISTGPEIDEAVTLWPPSLRMYSPPMEIVERLAEKRKIRTLKIFHLQQIEDRKKKHIKRIQNGHQRKKSEQFAGNIGTQIHTENNNNNNNSTFNNYTNSGHINGNISLASLSSSPSVVVLGTGNSPSPAPLSHKGRHSRQNSKNVPHLHVSNDYHTNTNSGNPQEESSSSLSLSPSHVSRLSGSGHSKRKSIRWHNGGDEGESLSNILSAIAISADAQSSNAQSAPLPLSISSPSTPSLVFPLLNPSRAKRSLDVDFSTSFMGELKQIAKQIKEEEEKENKDQNSNDKTQRETQTDTATKQEEKQMEIQAQRQGDEAKDSSSSSSSSYEISISPLLTLNPNPIQSHSHSLNHNEKEREKNEDTEKETQTGNQTQTQTRHMDETHCASPFPSPSIPLSPSPALSSLPPVVRIPSTSSSSPSPSSTSFPRALSPSPQNSISLKNKSPLVPTHKVSPVFAKSSNSPLPHYPLDNKNKTKIISKIPNLAEDKGKMESHNKRKTQNTNTLPQVKGKPKANIITHPDSSSSSSSSSPLENRFPPLSSWTPIHSGGKSPIPSWENNKNSKKSPKKEISKENSKEKQNSKVPTAAEKEMERNTPHTLTSSSCSIISPIPAPIALPLPLTPLIQMDSKENQNVNIQSQISIPKKETETVSSPLEKGFEGSNPMTMTMHSNGQSEKESLSSTLSPSSASSSSSPLALALDPAFPSRRYLSDDSNGNGNIRQNPNDDSVSSPLVVSPFVPLNSNEISDILTILGIFCDQFKGQYNAPTITKTQTQNTTQTTQTTSTSSMLTTVKEQQDEAEEEEEEESKKSTIIPMGIGKGEKEKEKEDENDKDKDTDRNETNVSAPSDLAHPLEFSSSSPSPSPSSDLPLPLLPSIPVELFSSFPSSSFPSSSPSHPSSATATLSFLDFCAPRLSRISEQLGMEFSLVKQQMEQFDLQNQNQRQQTKEQSQTQTPQEEKIQETKVI